jgi:hypothetical protein
VDDVKSISALGYEYDRYDSMRGGLGPFATRGDARGQSAGVGKTFAVRLPRAAARNAQQAYDLLVSGIPEHPRQSYFVYVFVNQPQATPEDATPDNPN